MKPTELRYRAYNTITKTWAGWDSFGMHYEYYGVSDHLAFQQRPNSNYQKEGWVIMLYSGTNDINKNEICESDIVEVNTTGMNYHNDTVKGIVRFIDGCFTVEFETPIYDIVLKCKRPRRYVKCFTVNHAIKVIGNIHDNLEDGDKIICATE